MKSINLAVVAGDGIGPEVVASARAIVEATGAPIDWEEAEAGAEVVDVELITVRGRLHLSVLIAVMQISTLSSTPPHGPATMVIRSAPMALDWRRPSRPPPWPPWPA